MAFNFSDSELSEIMQVLEEMSDITFDDDMFLTDSEEWFQDLLKDLDLQNLDNPDNEVAPSSTVQNSMAEAGPSTSAQRSSIPEQSGRGDPRTSVQSVAGPSKMGEASYAATTDSATDDAAPASEGFRVIDEEERYFRRFQTTGKVITFLMDTPDPQQLTARFEDLLRQVKRGVQNPADRIGLSLDSPRNEKAVHLSMRRSDQLSSHVVLQMLERCVQSNEEFLAAGTLKVHVTHVQMPHGSGKKLRKDVNSTFAEYCRRRGGIVTINNGDNLCLARALVVAIAWRQKDLSVEHARIYKRVSHPQRSFQKEQAERLCSDASVNLANGAGLEEIRALQHHLSEYKITVFSGRSGRDVLFEGPDSTPTEPREHLDLLFEAQHFNVITSVLSAFSCKKYCRECKAPHDHAHAHRCESRCPSCLSAPKCDGERYLISCNKCCRSFKNATCFQSHLQSKDGKTCCEMLKKCKTCLKVCNLKLRKSAHVCGESFCPNCRDFKPSGHLCYIKPLKDGKGAPDFLFIFFDLECTQDSVFKGKDGNFEHVPNLCVSQQVCASCVSVDADEYRCPICGPRLRVFRGVDCVSTFMDYVRGSLTSKIRNVTLIAHNASGYDGHFILKHMVESMQWNPEIIANGRNIIYMKYGNVRIVDSLNFFGTSLSKLPKMFNFPDVQKGYFPHFFNTSANQAYVGKIPPADCYGIDDMSVSDREQFLKWYEAKTTDASYIFNLQNEMLSYCKLDVSILRKACVHFRRIFIKETTIDPFLESVTIASACMRVFQKLFLKPETIAIVPPNGYRCCDRQSHIATQWICWESSKLDVPIQHSLNGREIKILGKKVDGYAVINGIKSIFEFEGCVFHGCVKCFKSGRDLPLHTNSSETMNTRFESTASKRIFFENRGYRVIEMWECNFKSMISTMPELQNFIQNLQDSLRITPLDPRDSFYGGRTNAVKLYHRVDKSRGERILYFDVCSLYPYVCKYGKMPVGHPKISFGADCPQDLTGIEGLVKLSILPPQNLYHPVLPVKVNGKLCFPLCFSCCINSNQSECTHSEEERALTGCWVTDEVHKALSLGYKIIKIFEMWEYETTTYDGDNGGLFVEYINKFLKMKQEASGFPEWCNSAADKQKYIHDYREHEGILLNESNIQVNPGFRSLAKLMLNSFWGKFGQRPDRQKCKILKSREELLDLLTHPTVDNFHIASMTDEFALVSWSNRAEDIEPLPNANVVIAAYVTAQARLKLYGYLEKYDQRILYFDTDSFFLTTLPGESIPSAADYLGELKDELAEFGPDAYIDEFVSGGPKNYAYRVVCDSKGFTKTVCKVRGITMLHRNREQVSFEKLKDMVLYDCVAPITHNPHKIIRPSLGCIISAPQNKVFKVTYTKRKIIDHFDTVPYGFKKARL